MVKIRTKACFFRTKKNTLLLKGYFNILKISYLLDSLAPALPTISMMSPLIPVKLNPPS